METLAVIDHPAVPELPALIADAGAPAARRFLEFFTVNIRNKNTRASYEQAAGAFLRWCEGQRIGELGRVQPVHVAESNSHYVRRKHGSCLTRGRGFSRGR